MRRKLVLAIVMGAVGALLLVAAGCGGDDDESAADTQAAAVETSGSEDATETETEAMEETDTESSDSSETPDFGSAEDCAELAALGEKTSSALSGTGGTDLEETQEVLNEFADDAPDEIKDDFQVIADAFSKIAEALEGVDLTSGETPDPEALQKLTELQSEIDQAELTQANTNITTWVQENCGAAN